MSRWISIVCALSCATAMAAPTRSSAPKKADLSPKSSSPGSQDPFSFDLLDSGGKDKALRGVKEDPEFLARVHRRRTMLTVHQVLGLTTLASLAATAVVGQLNLNDRFGGNGDTGRYNKLHAGMAFATTGLFLTTGLVALLAPEPYEKHLQLDTATFHKLLMGLATVGMLAQVALGVYAVTREGQLNERDLATVHQIIGYSTLGAMAGGALVLTF